MKNLYALLVVSAIIVQADVKEVGRHDQGDYACWIPGAKDGRIYPTSEQKKNLVDTYYEDFCIDCCKHVLQQKVDFEAIRNQFPIVQQMMNNYPLIYLDSASTAQMPQSVLDAIVEYYDSYKSNAGRGLYELAWKVTQTVEQVREKVANFIGAKKYEVAFVQGTTAGLNLVAKAWAEHNLQAGDEIIVSELEHNANFLPWQQLALRNELQLTIVPVTQRGVVDVQTLRDAVSSKTKLVAITHQSNVLGTTNDIAALADVVHSVGAKFVVDGAQSIVHQKVDVAQLGCDFFSFSAHKLYGPTGIGAVFIKEDLFNQLNLQNFGGGMVIEVGDYQSEFKKMPHCLEAGTQPLAQIIGLGAAIDFVQQNIDFTQAQEHETALVRKLHKALQEIPGMNIISPYPEEGEHNNMVVFISDNYHAYDIAEYLNKYGIAVRAGYHCVHIYHEKIGGRASVRVSFSVYNTQKEIDFVIDRLKSLLL